MQSEHCCFSEPVSFDSRLSGAPKRMDLHFVCAAGFIGFGSGVFATVGALKKL
jgi:hypothetical protein